MYISGKVVKCMRKVINCSMYRVINNTSNSFSILQFMLLSLLIQPPRQHWPIKACLQVRPPIDTLHKHNHYFLRVLTFAYETDNCYGLQHTLEMIMWFWHIVQKMLVAKKLWPQYSIYFPPPSTRDIWVCTLGEHPWNKKAIHTYIFQQRAMKGLLLQHHCSHHSYSQFVGELTLTSNANLFSVSIF